MSHHVVTPPQLPSGTLGISYSAQVAALSLLLRLKGGSLKCCQEEAVKSVSHAFSRTMCIWHPGHHYQPYGDFTAGPSGIGKAGIFWGFQHSSTSWGQQVSFEDFYCKRKQTSFSIRSESSHPALVLVHQR